METLVEHGEKKEVVVTGGQSFTCILYCENPGVDKVIVSRITRRCGVGELECGRWF